MNYPGLENLRADVAALSNAMCDVRMLLNRLESQHRHDAANRIGMAWEAGRQEPESVRKELNNVRALQEALAA